MYEWKEHKLIAYHHELYLTQTILAMKSVYILFGSQENLTGRGCDTKS